MICVSIGRTRHKMVILEHRALAERGAELVELRIDWLSREPDIPRLLRDRPTGCIVTCRRQSDRGRWRGSEEQRLALLRTAIVEGAEYVDLEDDIAGKIPRYGETKRIVSHHNFEETPDDLADIHAQMCQLDPDIIKLVTMANTPADMVKMLQLVDSAKVPTVGFCMGELGMASRVLCGKYGSPFTYACFSRERELAPGQIAFEDMQQLYDYERINGDTQVMGVLGDPLAQSLSPLLHNTAFRERGMNCVYLPFRVPRHALRPTLDAFDWLDIRGYSVTIPHKGGVLEKARQQDDAVSAIGAANTLVRDDAGQWTASNTDYEAALASVRLGMCPDDPSAANLSGKKVLVLGAGGAARAVVLGMVRSGAVVTIANRNASRAAELATEFKCQHVGWENRGSVYADILINCTPVGMHPHVNDTPFPMNWLRDGMLVFDTVYNPENTLLLKQARSHQCLTVSGLEMFVRQAAAQFERFTGEPAPLELMRETARKGISAVQH